MKWKKIIRETGLREWVCEHGIGHPDEISAHIMAAAVIHDAGINLDNNPDYFSDGTDVIKGKLEYKDVVGAWLVHGCDGCCQRDDFPGAIKK